MIYMRKKSSLAFLSACIAISSTASAQSSSAIELENQRLRAQIQTMQQAGCNAPAPDQATWHDAQLSAHIASIRVGALGLNGIGVTVSITLTNTGTTPLALNYVNDSFSITDSNGYRYTNRNATDYGDIKGIPIATNQRADTRQPLMPGQSSTVTILSQRSMPRGQTPGQHFDVSATFAAFVDEGQGRIRKTQSFPVSFTNVPAGSNISAQQANGQETQGARQTARRFLEGLIN